MARSVLSHWSDNDTAPLSSQILTVTKMALDYVSDLWDKVRVNARSTPSMSGIENEMAATIILGWIALCGVCTIWLDVCGYRQNEPLKIIKQKRAMTQKEIRAQAFRGLP